MVNPHCACLYRSRLLASSLAPSRPPRIPLTRGLSTRRPATTADTHTVPCAHQRRPSRREPSGIQRGHDGVPRHPPRTGSESWRCARTDRSEDSSDAAHPGRAGTRRQSGSAKAELSRPHRAQGRPGDGDWPLTSRAAPGRPGAGRGLRAFTRRIGAAHAGASPSRTSAGRVAARARNGSRTSQPGGAAPRAGRVVDERDPAGRVRTVARAARTAPGSGPGLRRTVRAATPIVSR